MCVYACACLCMCVHMLVLVILGVQIGYTVGNSNNGCCPILANISSASSRDMVLLKGCACHMHMVTHTHVGGECVAEAQ